MLLLTKLYLHGFNIYGIKDFYVIRVWLTEDGKNSETSNPTAVIYEVISNKRTVCISRFDSK